MDSFWAQHRSQSIISGVCPNGICLQDWLQRLLEIVANNELETAAVLPRDSLPDEFMRVMREATDLLDRREIGSIERSLRYWHDMGSALGPEQVWHVHMLQLDLYCPLPCPAMCLPCALGGMGS